MAAGRDGGEQGRPNVYRPTPQLLQASGVQTLEELREGMGITKPSGAPHLWVADEPNTDAALDVGDDQVGA